jgi:predicted nucleotidyltransferase
MDFDDRLRQTLIAHGGIRLAIMFGSLARGGATQASDLDLAVLMDAPLSMETKLGLIDVLSQTFGRPVDLIDLQRVGEPLLGQILKYGVRLLGSDTDHARLITRHLLDEADFMPYRRRILAERRRAWIAT